MLPDLNTWDSIPFRHIPNLSETNLTTHFVHSNDDCGLLFSILLLK